MPAPTTAGPAPATLRLSVLPPADLERVHDLALHILESTGITLHYPPARALLRSHGASVDETTALAHIPRRLVQQALATTPHRVTLHCHGDPGQDCHLATDGGTYARTGTGLNWIVDQRSTTRRAVVTADLERWIRLAGAQPNIHIVGALYDQEPVPQAMDVRAVAPLLRYTSKPLMISALSGEGIRWVKRLVDAAQPAGRPNRLMVLSSVNSPLTYGFGQLEAAWVAAEVGIPVVINSSAVTGVSAPVTLAGSLVQLHAEMLAALVVLQLHRPGAPLVYSGHPVVMDMRNGMSAMGTPEVGLLSAGCVDLARYCGLPSGSDGLTADSCLPDAMAVSEKWATGLLPLLAGANVNGAAGVFGTQSTVSLEQLVIDDEVYGAMFRLARGFAVSEETLAAPVIEYVGSNGSYLMEEHTRAHMRSEIWYPRLATRLGAAAWEAAGAEDTMQRAAEMMQDTLSTPPTPCLSDTQQREVSRLLRQAQAALREIEIPI